MITITKICHDCPCCGQHFRSTTCTFKNILGPTTTDFFSKAAGEQYIHHLVHTCTFCGYSFEEPDKGEVSDHVKAFVREKITPQLKGGDVPSWRKFEYLAMIDEELGADTYSLGMHYLQAAWCCHDLEDPEEEERYRAMAIKHLSKAFKPSTMDRELLFFIPYLVAEQYRRIGNVKKANQWYDKVIKMDEEHPDRDFFVSLAIHQKDNPVEFMDDIMHPSGRLPVKEPARIKNP